MNEFRADLHTHSTCSDGSLSPTALVQLAVESGLKGLSITDHDTVAAYAEAIPAAERAGLSLVTGVEFSTFHDQESIHILGYAFTLDDAGIAALCARQGNRRTGRNKEILVKLQALGMPLTEEELAAEAAGAESVGRPHIALAMVKHGYVATPQEAFDKFLMEGKPAYSAGTPISTEEAIAAIQAAGGYAVLAHPHIIKKDKLLRSLLKLPFDGIECYYGRFAKQMCRRWLDIAAARHWIPTGGSDFHGTMKPHISLGSSWVPETIFTVLAARSRQNQKI